MEAGRALSWLGGRGRAGGGGAALGLGGLPQGPLSRASVARIEATASGSRGHRNSGGTLVTQEAFMKHLLCAQPAWGHSIGQTGALGPVTLVTPLGPAGLSQHSRGCRTLPGARWTGRCPHRG